MSTLPAAPAVEAQPADRLPRRLGVWSAAAILVGTTIGSGIFRVPGVVAAETGSVGGIVLLWIVGALIALFGALTVAELAAMFPRSGGLYGFLREAYGPLAAFLFGWTRLLVIQPSVFGAIALIFAAYASAFYPLADTGERLVAAGLIVLLASANYRSLLWGAAVQNASTVAKVAALVGLAAAAFRGQGRGGAGGGGHGSGGVGRVRGGADRRALDL